MLTIYGVPLSVHTRKVIVAAILKRLDYANEPVIPFNPPADWQSLSPTGLIPAIRHDGFELADSAAICAYLERLAPTPALYPAEAQALGRALWLEEYGSAVLFGQLVRPLFHQLVIGPKILQHGGPDAAEVRRLTEEVGPGVLGYLEGEAAAGRLGTGAFSIAELSIASNLINLGYLGIALDAARYPRLGALLAKALREPAVEQALRAELPFVERLGLEPVAALA
jgi:glutathione S-transferase